MKNIFKSFYGKLSAVFLLLLIVLGSTQIYLTYHSSMRFVEEADQKLNLNLARNMAAELKPMLSDSVSVPAIQQSIHYMMVLNPKIEIYLLDHSGKILAYFADPPQKVEAKTINLDPIHEFLQSDQQSLILGDDPRQPGRQKPFSAANLHIGGQPDGYLYIILGGEQYETAVSMVKDSYILRTSIQSLIIIIIFTGIIGLILFAFLTRRLRTMMSSVRQFEQGNYKQRIPVKSEDEIGRLAATFNKMADTIEEHMNQLKRTDKLRRDLVANVSHDLRSPLASMHGYLETILMKAESLSKQERQRYLDIIMDNTEKLSRLVEELFELSKLDAHQVEPEFEYFSIAELTQDVVMKLKFRANDKNVNLNADLPRNLSPVYADIGLIERALTNIIENALRYTPEGGRVEVYLNSTNHHIRVSIHDTGCGIPEDEIPHIFERFYRVDKSRNKKNGSTGLGLAIADKIMELHETEIKVESEINKGTTFYFDLQALNSN